MSTIKLLRINHVPSDFREPFIMSGYRSCRSSVASCILSAFRLNNETFNFWTHFLPFGLFAWTFTQTLWSEMIFEHDPFIYPLQVYLASVCLFMLASSCAHLFNSMSERAHHICFFFDYGAISMYGLASGVMYNTYVFPEPLINSTFHACYLPVIVFGAVLCTFLGCLYRLISRRFIRILAYSTQYIFCSFPLFYRCSLSESGDLHSNAIQCFTWHFLLCFISVVLYGSHFPEVWAPGKFDTIGNSHQLFHVTGTIATYFQLQGSILDVQNRRSYLLTVLQMPTLASTAGIVLIVLIVNLGIIVAFTALVWNKNSLRRIKQRQGILTIQTMDKQRDKLNSF